LWNQQEKRKRAGGHGPPFEALENAPFLKKRSTRGERNIEEQGIGYWGKGIGEKKKAA
jgi:hypothetical protein